MGKKEQKPKLAIILSTAREGRESEKIARFVFEMSRLEFVSRLVDVKDYLLAKTHTSQQENRQIKNWRKVVDWADGFVFVVPEYNHSFPGELKIILDSAYQQYKGKPAGLCGVSSGGLGGARVVEQIKPVLNALGMVLPSFSVYFSNVRDFNPEQLKKNKTEYTENLAKLFNEIKGLF